MPGKSRVDIEREHRIAVLTMDMARTYFPYDGTCMIRIQSHDEPFRDTIHEALFKEVLRIHFDDCRDASDGRQPLTSDQAALIVDFFERNRGNHFVVHCHAGMNRSPSVAAAWALYNKDYAAASDIGVAFPGNAQVYRTIVEEMDRRGLFT